MESSSTNQYFSTHLFSEALKKLSVIQPNCIPQALSSHGKVIRLTGGTVVATLPRISINNLCKIKTKNGDIYGVITSFEGNLAYISILDNTVNISVGDEVFTDHSSLSAADFQNRFGILLDGLGKTHKDTELESSNLNKINKKFAQGNFADSKRRFLRQKTDFSESKRKTIDRVFTTNISILDNYIKVGIGQRIGVFAPAGLGKSFLVRNLLEKAVYDVAVVGLIGERAREVVELQEYLIKTKIFPKILLIAETADKSPLRRFYAAQTATAYAEFFRKQGKNVLLIIDSLTRTARAIRDYSLEAGEIPLQRGLTPTVYRELPKLIEKNGNYKDGSVTAFYTILTDENEDDDPLAQEIKSLLDGHLILTTVAREEGFMPAVDPILSLSRVQTQLCSKEELDDINYIKKILTRIRRDRGLILLGGTPDSELKIFLENEEEIIRVLNAGSFPEAVRLSNLIAQIKAQIVQRI